MDQKGSFQLPPEVREAMKQIMDAGGPMALLTKIIQQTVLSFPNSDPSQPKFGMASWFDDIGKRFKNSKKAQLLLDAGWVPYAGISLNGLANDATADDVTKFVETQLRDKWTDARQAMHHTVANSGVDEEALATFVEALDAFEAGHYRSVVRVLFPEIERVARETIYAGSRKDWSIERKEEKRSMNTGLGALRQALMKHLPLGLSTHSDFGISLTQKMDSHLYQWVGTTENELDRYRADPVPNRHASQHGYVIYSSQQNAFNAISMAAFMFEIIMRAHRYLLNNASKAATSIQSSAAKADNP
jgi:hypothetical protein